MRMSVASFEHLYGRVRPFLRRARDGKKGRRPTIPPPVRLLVVLFWLAHAGLQFVACEVADLEKPTLCAILREVLHPGHVILSYGGFALEYWLLKPYPQQQLTLMRKVYNYCISSPRAIVENSFDLLKGRWRVLHEKLSADIELVPDIVESCALLHNFLIDEKDEWVDVVDATDGEPRDVHPDVGVTRAYQMALRLRDEWLSISGLKVIQVWKYKPG